MHIMSVWLYVLVLSLQFVGGRNSPCPDIFDYVIDGDNIFGIITVKPKDDQRPSSVLEIRLNVTMTFNIDSNWKKWCTERSKSEQLEDEEFDGIEPLSSENLRMYNEGQAIKYQIHFFDIKTMLPLPKVDAISVNGDIICDGREEKPGPNNNVVALVSLHHKSVLKSGMLGSTYETQEQEAPVMIVSACILNVCIPFLTGYWYSDSSPKKQWQASNGGQRKRDLVPIVQNQEPIKRNQEPSTTDECGVVAGGNERVPLINKGNFYERGEIPWLVAIYRVVDNNLLFICGGTLVSNRHVVTAAHCMQRRNGVTHMRDVVVKVGVHSLNGWSDDLTITRQLMAATVHKEYNPFTLQNDILILTLDRRVKFNRYIRPACLWSGETELSRVVGASGVVAGWGRGFESMGGKQSEPRKLRVPIVSTKDCRASQSYFHRLTSNTTLCAGDRNGAGPCTGDSGGGLYLLEGGKWRIRGVVSVSVESENGTRTCNLNEYVVYTDTAQYLPWVRSILSKKYYD